MVGISDEEDRSSEEHVAEQQHEHEQEEDIGTPGHLVQRHQGESELRLDSDFFRDFRDFFDESDMVYAHRGC